MSLAFFLESMDRDVFERRRTRRARDDTTDDEADVDRRRVLEWPLIDRRPLAPVL